jgi:23S rRNA pseudouridine2605 synthase
MIKKSKSSRKPTDQSRKTSSRTKKTSEPAKKSTYRTRGKSSRSVKKTDDFDESAAQPRPAGTGKKPFKKSGGKKGTAADSGLIRLNKYLADAGICSRREADTHIAGGAVMVNNKIVIELGTKVSLTDKVQYGGETLNRETLKYFLYPC